MLANLFGTMERMRFLFRDTLEAVRRLVALQVDPLDVLAPAAALSKTPWTAWHALPRRVSPRPGAGTPDDDRPTAAVEVWPDDGGPYITLPQVYTEDPDQPGLDAFQPGHVPRAACAAASTQPNREVGLHYQLHRGIGAHHAAAIRRKERLRVNVFVGGPPAMTVAAVMPLPEGISELAFAGILGGRRVPMICRPQPAADPRRGRFLHQRLHRSAAAAARGPLRRSPGLLQPGARLSRDARSSASIIAATPFGRSPWSAARRRKTRCSAVDPRVGRAGDSAGDPRRAGGPRRGGGRRASAAAGHRQRALRALSGRAAAAGTAHRWPTPCWATASCRWPSIC